MKESRIIEGLNELLKKNYDAEKGYEQIAEKVDHPVLAALLRGKASNRYMYGHQIKDILREMEGEIDKGSSTMGVLHRVWIEIKDKLTSHTEEALLEEIERGESFSLKEYDAFLAIPNLPDSIRRIIKNQRDHIARSLTQVMKYEEEYA